MNNEYGSALCTGFPSLFIVSEIPEGQKIWHKVGMYFCQKPSFSLIKVFYRGLEKVDIEQLK